MKKILVALITDNADVFNSRKFFDQIAHLHINLFQEDDKKASEYDQDITQSHNAGQPMAP